MYINPAALAAIKARSPQGIAEAKLKATKDAYLNAKLGRAAGEAGAANKRKSLLQGAFGDHATTNAAPDLTTKLKKKLSLLQAA